MGRRKVIGIGVVILVVIVVLLWVRSQLGGLFDQI
jgi:hypothetical protein